MASQRHMNRHFRDIADLLSDSRHEIIESGTYGSRLHSTVSTLLIKSSPKKVALLTKLTSEQKEKIKEAALLFYPIQDNCPEIREILFKAIPSLAKKLVQQEVISPTSSLISGITYCVIVAVENYSESEDFPDVDFARKDADDFLESLKMLGYDPSYLALLKDTKATRGTIIQKVKYYSELAQSNDRLIFYFAGHGFYENGKNLLAPFDAIKIDKLETCVSMDQILGLLNKSKCQNSLLFIDCCHSGFDFSGNEREGEDSFSAEDLIHQFRNEQFCIGFASCKSNQKSISHKDLENGVWSHFLNKALRGEAEGIYTNNLLFSDSLQNYLKEETSQYVKLNTEKRKDQTPVKFGIETDKFIVADLSKLSSVKTNNTFQLPLKSINSAQELNTQKVEKFFKTIRKGDRMPVHLRPDENESFVVAGGIDFNFDTLCIKYNKKYADSILRVIYEDANGSQISYDKLLEDGGSMTWMNEEPTENPNFGFIGFSCSQEIFLEFSFS